MTATISTSSASFGDSSSKRKRKKKDVMPSVESNKGSDWTFYQPPAPSYPVFETSAMRIIGDIDVLVFKSVANTHYSAPDKAWICYRQNQFKVSCFLKCPQVQLFIRDGAMDLEVRQFFAKLYAIKSTSLGVGEEVQVGLCHTGKSRVKKEKTEISPAAFTDGKVEFANLQFERSNAAKGQQEYFHLVVTLFAKTNENYYPVLSKISPRIMVRSQHPAFYGQTTVPTTESPEPVFHQGSNTSSEDGKSPKPIDVDQAWQQNGDAVFHIGKVGVNTSDPAEALTVHGNALITGDLYKPSDRRIKSNFAKVDTNEQLSHIRELQIYDYDLTTEKRERGVIAQELQQVHSPAVHEAGDVNINGKVVPNLLVVNERSLLYENIGATQQLDKDLHREKSNIVQIDTRVADLHESAAKTAAQLQDQINSISDLFFAEETPEYGIAQPGSREEQVIFGINLFRMGPARTIMVLGYLFPWLWLVGTLFLFSNTHSRLTIGRTCMAKFVVWWTVVRFVISRGYGNAVILQWSYIAIGIGLLMENWRRNRNRIRAREQGLQVKIKPYVGRMPLYERIIACCRRNKEDKEAKQRLTAKSPI